MAIRRWLFHSFAAIRLDDGNTLIINRKQQQQKNIQRKRDKIYFRQKINRKPNEIGQTMNKINKTKINIRKIQKLYVQQRRRNNDYGLWKRIRIMFGNYFAR